MTYPYTRATFGAKDTAAPAGGAIAASLPSCRLWSLWEMLEFNAADFMEATAAIQHTLTHIDAKKLSSLDEHEDGSATITPITDLVFLNALSNDCMDLMKHLEVLNARLTMIAVREMLDYLGDGLATYGSIATGYRDIGVTLRRELTLVKLLCLSSKEQELYAPTTPLFGAEFAENFVSGIFELDEAAKCLALGRSTAAVFHLMRLMELGIRAVAQCLGLANPVKGGDRSWGTVLRAMKENMQTRGKSGWKDTGDKEFFESVYASIDAVRVAWRNTTMHVENKYTTDEAEHIFSAAKGFMKKLASRMDELGMPAA